MVRRRWRPNRFYSEWAAMADKPSRPSGIALRPQSVRNRRSRLGKPLLIFAIIEKPADDYFLAKQLLTLFALL